MEEKEQKNVESRKNKKVIITAIVLLLLIIVATIIVFNRNENEFNVAFETDGGSIIETITVSENSTITKPENPIKENYRFVGWYYNNELYDFSRPVTSDIKLEARWEILKNNSEIKLEKTELTLDVGSTINLMQTIMQQNENLGEVILESSNSDIVSIDSNGNVEALKEGSSVITIKTKDGKHTAKLTITVNATDIDETNSNETSVKVTGVSLNKTTLTLTQGQTAKLTVTVKPSNATNKNVTWKSSNSNIVTVDSKGNIKAIKEGSATITVTTTDGKYTAKATITVKGVNAEKPAPEETSVNVTGVLLNTTVLNLTEGDNSKLTATVQPSNATNKKVTWMSSNSSVVSVDTNGNINALKAGSATITVTTQDGNYKATCQVTVKEKPASYSVSFEAIKLQGINSTYQYNVIVKMNGNVFNGWNGIEFNNLKFKNGAGTINEAQYNGITNATITLSDGVTVVRATVNK